MSDADDSDFDKEAERERLREKYERDKEDRAAAEQMSDLLLKGATMTNGHCGQCGSPVFRQNGQEFCPNCSAGANEAAETAESAANEQPQDGSTDEQSADEQLADVVSDDEESEPASTGGTSIAERAAASVQSTDDVSQPDAGDSPASGEPATPTAPSATGDASLADAQQSLLNAITQHARAATDADPRTAKDHLEAASEAAEALAELSQ